MPLHHVALDALDYEATRRFYTEGLGLTARIEWGTPGSRATMLAIPGGGHVEVFERTDRGLPTEPAALLHFAIKVESTEAAYRRALAHGATARSAPQRVRIDGTSTAEVHIAFCTGLDGEIIEFFESADL